MLLHSRRSWMGGLMVRMMIMMLQDGSLRLRNNEQSSHNQHIGSRPVARTVKCRCGTYTKKSKNNVLCKEAMGIFSGLAK